ncbi:MAG: hypothetical protein KAH17_08425 [Bacteroidales bacterium]|nr:hypothetical protein [Bacteroidales bacterium]
MMQQRAISKRKLSLRVQVVAFPGVEDKLLIRAKKQIISTLKGIDIDFVNKDPLAIYFVTGGSEPSAISAIAERRHILLLAFSENNAYASASEVKACLESKGISSWLCNMSDESSIPQLKEMVGIWTKVRGFTHKRVGIIGKPSEWLVYSKPKADDLRIRFGIRLVSFQWSDLPDPLSVIQSGDFLEFYKGHGDQKIEDHSRVHSMLQEIVENNKLDGIAVECFPMVKEKGITACLSLARLNDIGVPAACEGDLVSLAGMLLIQQLTGIIPWMANLSGVFSDHAEFSHCTISPRLTDNFRLTSHFETGKGLSIAGDLPQQDYTVFRWNQSFDRCFITMGTKIKHDWSLTSCRTQLHLKINSPDLIKLQNLPLGNHHLILPGDHSDTLRIACEYLNFTII